LKQRWPHVIIEVSGGLTDANAAEFMLPDVDVLSFGALTQGVPHIDFSFKIQPSNTPA
jgi:nicotinate-nucleotide pyrophosphorylase (carboxylating)